MKKYLHSILFFCSTVVVAQEKAPGTYLELGINQNKDLTIWSEDFANGIPTDWVNQESSGIAAWEYRGPNTSPDITIGSRGACNPNFQGAPIQSETASNGFILFDSNYWDNNANPCTPNFFGTGPAPGPHYATLETPSIDLSAVTYAAFEMDQYVRFYQGVTSIQMSVNQSNWSTFYSNTLNTGASTDNPTHLRIPIPAAANQSDVRFRFVYDGLYYFWQIDDVRVIEVAANDLALEEVHFGDFDLLNAANPTGYEWMEYSQYPKTQAPLLKLWSMTQNKGGLAQTGCGLDARIYNTQTNSLVQAVTQPVTFTVPVAQTTELRAGAYQMPLDTGNFKIIYRAFQTENEDVPEDNIDSSFFRISPCVMARDNGALTSIYMGSDAVNNQPFEIGNIMLPTAEMKAAAITVGWSQASPVSNGQVRGRVHQFVFNDSITTTLIGETPWIDMDMSTANADGENKFQVLNFTDTVVLNAQTPYWITIETNNAPNEVYVGMSGESEMFTSWIFSQGYHYYLSKKPMIRIQSCMDTITHQPQDTTWIQDFDWANSLFLYPNPSQESFSIMNMQGMSIQEVNIYNEFGQKVKLIIQPSGTIDISDLARGVYFVELKANNEKHRRKLVKQ
jgi:hypothetical protein